MEKLCGVLVTVQVLTLGVEDAIAVASVVDVAVVVVVVVVVAVVAVVVVVVVGGGGLDVVKGVVGRTEVESLSSKSM